MKVPFNNYADMESLLEITFDITKTKLDCYRGKDCMKPFSKDLRKHVTKIIKCEKKGTDTLTIEENKSYQEQKVCYLFKK